MNEHKTHNEANMLLIYVCLFTLIIWLYLDVQQILMLIFLIN
jgi:hypothetical protein